MIYLLWFLCGFFVALFVTIVENKKVLEGNDILLILISFVSGPIGVLTFIVMYFCWYFDTHPISFKNPLYRGK